MQKKIISIIIALTLVISSFSCAFAVDISTPQAISFDAPFVFNAVKSSAVLQATTSTVVVPESSSATKWYINNNGLVSSASTTITTWGNIVTQITDSLAQSLYRVVVSVNNVYSALNSYLNSNNTTSYYTWSWSESDGVQQGAPNGSQSAIVALRNYGSALTKLLSQNIEQIFQIRSLLENGVGYDTVKIADNPSNGYNMSYLWGKYTPMNSLTGFDWFNGRSKVRTSFDYQNSPLLGSIFYHIRINGTSLVNLAESLVGSIGSYSLTNDDLTTIPFGDNTSIANDIRNIGSNLSGPLHRLAFVLASQEEIEARQAASDNTSAVVDDFIKPTGSGSASASDFADVASIGSTMKDALSSNIGAENAFTSLDSSSEAWNWFSQGIADSLDTSSSSTRRSVYSYSYPTPMLDSYYSQLMETLKVKHAR